MPRLITPAPSPLRPWVCQSEHSSQITSEQILPPSCWPSFSSVYFRLAFRWRGCLSICQYHPDDHCFDSAGKSRVDRCPASIHWSFSRHHCCPPRGRDMAGTVSDCRKKWGSI